MARARIARRREGSRSASALEGAAPFACLRLVVMVSPFRALALAGLKGLRYPRLRNGPDRKNDHGAVVAARNVDLYVARFAAR